MITSIRNPWIFRGFIFIAGILIGYGVINYPLNQSGDNDRLYNANSLSDALNVYGWVEGEIRAFGEPEEGNLILSVRRLVLEDLTLTIPIGSLLLNDNDKEPNLIFYKIKGIINNAGIIRSADYIELNNDEWHEYILEAYSLDFDLGDISPISSFILIDPLPSDVISILQTAALLDAPSREIQIAIWIITDGIDEKMLESQGYQAFQYEIQELFRGSDLKTERYRYFDIIARQTPDEFIARGIKYTEMGEFIQGIADFSAAIDLDGNLPEGYYRRGVAYMSIEEYTLAMQDLQRALDFNQEDPFINSALGYIEIFKQPPDFNLAIRYLDQAIDLEEDFTMAYYLRGLANYGKSEFELAVNDFSKAIEQDGDFDEAYLRRGLAYLGVQDVNNAIDDFTAAISLNNEFVDAYLTRGNTYYELDEYSKAIKDFNMVLELQPDNGEIFRLRGMAYYDGGYLDLAIKDFESFVTLYPQSSEAIELLALLALLEIPSSPPTDDALSIYEALDLGKITASVLSTGTASGDSLLLNIQRTSDQRVEIFIPRGTIISGGTLGIQNFVVRQISGLAVSNYELLPMSSVILVNNEQLTYYVEAYSINFYKDLPETDAVLSVKDSIDNDITSVLEAADNLFGAGGDVISIQTAIWVITDDIGWIELTDKGYHPNLSLVQRILQSADFELECKNLFRQSSCPKE